MFFDANNKIAPIRQWASLSFNLIAFYDLFIDIYNYIFA